MSEETDKKTNNEKKEKKPSVFNKKYLGIVLILSVIIIIGLIWYSPQTIKIIDNDIDTSVAQAKLYINFGTVELKSADGSWKIPENGTTLYQSDSVRTGDNSSATIVLLKSSVIRLDNNTEITIKQIIDEKKNTAVSLDQNSGRTWNTISKISGIDDYEVETPTTVASVRGTSFVVVVKPDGETDVGVGHGFVNVSGVFNEQIMFTITLTKDQQVTINPDNISQPPEIMPFEKDDWILDNLEKDEEILKNEKQDLYDRIEEYIPELKETYNMTEQEIEALLEGYLLGYWSLPDTTPDYLREIIESP